MSKTVRRIFEFLAIACIGAAVCLTFWFLLVY